MVKKSLYSALDPVCNNVLAGSPVLLSQFYLISQCKRILRLDPRPCLDVPTMQCAKIYPKFVSVTEMKRERTIYLPEIHTSAGGPYFLGHLSVDLPILVLPRPGGVTKGMILPSIVTPSLRRGRNLRMRHLTSVKPQRSSRL